MCAFYSHNLLSLPILKMKISKSEIDIIAEKIGNHIDWYSIILETIHQHIEINQQTI